MSENHFKNKKVLILGLGLNQGGVGSAKFFTQLGAKVKVTDIKTAGELQPSLDQLKEFPMIEYVLGEHRYEDLDWADIIIRNPSLKPDNPYRIYAEKSGKRVEMDMGIFLQFIKPEQIIGVTGTKGKSTTASLIYEALKEACTEQSLASRSVVFAGNIGKSVLDTIPMVKKDTLVILELSSFQLEAFEEHQISPKWAVITNIFPDHLNYYQTIEQYTAAKRVIAQHQKPEDFLFIKSGDKVVDNNNFLQGLEGQIIRFSPSDLPAEFQPKLPGEHNLANIAAALAVSQKISLASQEDLLEALENFPGVEFRLQLIYSKRDLRIYNDSAATNPDATIQALKSLPNSILITGGVNKNLPYEEMAQTINKYAKAVFFLEGTATEEILQMLKSIGHQSADQNMGIYNNLEKLLRDIKDILKHGDVILFSPGAASFNLFQNEFDRGRKFNEAVEKVFG
ncbi:MAG: UDP-N-acetylmuramoyl-L-alanine--D-glutamate ligase [bacterium]|nr:UDP-N-acetylmuramoyl-L-alanine--D-glutamate ligase [bacterium]